MTLSAVDTLASLPRPVLEAIRAELGPQFANPQQQEFFDSHAPELLYSGAFRAGKSRIGCEKAYYIARQYPGIPIGIFRKTAYRQRPLRHEYRLTDKGAALFTVIVGLKQWGDRYGPAAKNGKPMELVGVPEPMVRLFSEVANMLGKGMVVKTVMAPYECQSCTFATNIHMYPKDVIDQKRVVSSRLIEKIVE